MFARRENKIPEKVKTLWDNICVYRKDSAKQISKRYDHDIEGILSTLASFPQARSYSGHQRGKKGSRENGSATQILTLAIQHLNDHAEQTPNVSPYSY